MEAELFLQSKRYDGNSGELPYTANQLYSYAKLKVASLRLGTPTCGNGIVPTVVFNRKLGIQPEYHDSSCATPLSKP